MAAKQGHRTRMTTSQFQKRWLNRKEAAAYLSLAVGTLANLASQGTGPKYRNPSGGARGGRALYDIADLDRWVLSHGTEVT